MSNGFTHTFKRLKNEKFPEIDTEKFNLFKTHAITFVDKKIDKI